MGVGYVKYDPTDPPIRQWAYTSKKGYTLYSDSKFAIVFDGVLVFYNEKKDPWGSIVHAQSKGEWINFYPVTTSSE